MKEKWENYYTPDQLKRLHEIELDNLRAFIDVCHKLHLEYFIYGGTLLGVEKYKGFIPWDDDIDVALPRESYEKFIREAPKHLPEKYFIQSPYNCLAYPFPYTKLKCRGTKYIEYVNRNIDIESGVYIDIYPVDQIPDDEELRKKQFQKARKWILIYVYRQSRLYDKKADSLPGKIKNIGKWVICNACKVFSQKMCIDKITYYMTMYNGTDSKRYAALNSPKFNNIYSDLYPLQEGLFEGIRVMMPGNHKEHLRMRYGDYSKLPPKDQRCGHVPYVLDLGEY